MTTLTYAMIREKLDGKPWTMRLASQDEIHAVVEAVNQGIDSHLEACNFPDLGDSYEMVEEKIGGKLVCRKMLCTVSVKSFPVLLRRLWETNDESTQELVQDILFVLGFPEDESFKIISPVDKPNSSN